VVPVQEIPAGGGPRVAPLNENYVGDVHQRIQRNWDLPRGTPMAILSQLSVGINLTLMSDGTIANVKVTKHSGDKPFDNSLLRAVKKAEPFPVPPANGAAAWEAEMMFTPQSN
jgi:TolA protein